MQIMAVQVPAGMQGGMVLQVQTPAGLMEVQIPDSLEPGMSFQIQVPMAAPVTPSPPVPPPPPPPPAPPPAPTATTSVELKALLLTLVRRLPERGLDAVQADVPPWEMDEIVEVVGKLEALDPSARDGWMAVDEWSGKWVMRYTSSKTFHRNEGVTGYAYSRPEVTTPDLTLAIDVPRNGYVTLAESILRPNAPAAVDGDVALAECLWQVGPNDMLKIEPRNMSADGRSWSPRDPNAGDEVCT